MISRHVRYHRRQVKSYLYAKILKWTYHNSCPRPFGCKTCRRLLTIATGNHDGMCKYCLADHL